MNILSTTVAYRAIAITSLSAVSLFFSPMTLAQGTGILDGWAGTATIGANRSTGNSESQNINGSIRLGKTVGRWEHLVFGSVFQGESTLIVPTTATDGTITNEIVSGDTSDRLAFGYQPKFYYTDKTYFFGILDWETDEPSNIDVGTRQVIGVGHRFFSTEKTSLSVEIGVGNRNIEVVNGDDVDGAIGYLGANYLNQLTDNISFNADLRSDFGSDNTYTELTLGLGARVSNRITAKVSYFARSNSDLTSDINPLSTSTDSVTSFQLAFDI